MLIWILVLVVITLFAVAGVSSALGRVSVKLEELSLEIEELRSDFQDKFGTKDADDDLL